MKQNLLDKLAEGDLRTTGKVNEIVKQVLQNPSMFEELYSALFHGNPGIRMRTADALVKITSQNPELIQPYKKELIDNVSRVDQPEVQWHLAQLYSYLSLEKDEEMKILDILLGFIKNTNSNIVKVFSLQTLADIAEHNKDIKSKVVELIKNEMEKGAPSVMSRGKKLLKQLQMT